MTDVGDIMSTISVIKYIVNTSYGYHFALEDIVRTVREP